MNVIFLFSLFTYGRFRKIRKIFFLNFRKNGLDQFCTAIRFSAASSDFTVWKQQERCHFIDFFSENTVIHAGPSSDLKKKKRSETSDDDSEETEKRAPKKKKRAGDKTSAISTTTHRIKNKKIQKKRKTLDEDENGETIEKKTGQQVSAL